MGFFLAKKVKRFFGLSLISFYVLAFFQNCNNFSVLNSSVDDSASYSSSSKSSTEKTAADASISANVFGTPLVISTTTRLAGAIGSLTWNGMEFINQDDHGRELQSASSFDGLGECWNPTEAGSSRDGTGDTSTSKLLGIKASGNQLATTIQMAFWNPAGSTFPQGCGGAPHITAAQNTTDLSNHTLSKQVTIGFAGIENVIEYLVTFHVTEHHNSAGFEAVTGYMPKEFSSFWTFDPASGALNTLDDGPGEQNLPVIFSTPDQKYAMGIYTPDLPQSNPYAGYARFDFAYDNTMKWSAPFRRGDTPAGDYGFRAYIIVGSLAQVTQGMTSVYQNFQPEVMGNIDGFYQDIYGQVFLNGWACARYMNDPISVHLYLNGVFGVGQIYNGYDANMGSEPEVAKACQAAGTNYRFSIPISAAMMDTYAGQTVWIHGISPVGLPNFTITNSGKFVIPSLKTLPPRQNIHRFYSPKTGEHLMTLNYSEGIGAGFKYEGVGFNTFTSSTNVSAAVAIYRCNWVSAGKHFVSTDPTCEKSKQEGSLGFIYQAQTLNSTPLYRFRNNTSHDHLTTTNYQEGVNNGYSLDGILGYVPTN